MRQCIRCVMDSNIPNITFDSNGLCSYCKLHDEMNAKYPIGKSGEEKVKNIVAEIKENGKDKKYDCVVGISGGCDSSFLIYQCKQFGLRPLAMTFDNTWSTPISTENISRLCEKLDIDLYTHVVDGDEFNDISRSFLYASVPDADVPNDIAISAMYYKACNKYDINYFICGHSFRTEGTVPLGWTYMDGKYIESVHRQFGTIPMKTFPNLDIDFWLANIHRKRVRLLYYFKYNKEEVKQMLTEKFGWQWYGGHHCENEYTKFVKNYLLPKKFGIDKRFVEFSALIRSGNMKKEEALEIMKTPPEVEPGFLDYVLKRLDLTNEEFDKIMKLPKKSYKDYPNNKEYFWKNKDMFQKMLDKGLIPQTFFEKYCK